MPDEPTPDAAAEAERPEWLAERYDSVEAQAKAYAESQAEMNRLRAQMEQERTSFASALEGFQQAAPPAQQYQAPQFDPSVSAFAQAWENGDPQAALQAAAAYTMAPTVEAVGRMLDERFSAITPAIQQATAAQREHDLRLAEGIVERQLGPERYTELLPRIRELAADNPNYLPQATSVEGYAASIMNIAKLAEHDTMQKQIADFQQERADKLNAQTLSGGYDRPTVNPDAARAEFERIKNTQTGSFDEVLARGRRAAQ